MHKNKLFFAPIMYKVHKSPGRELAPANRWDALGANR